MTFTARNGTRIVPRIGPQIIPRIVPPIVASRITTRTTALISVPRWCTLPLEYVARGNTTARMRDWGNLLKVGALDVRRVMLKGCTSISTCKLHLFRRWKNPARNRFYVP